MALVCQKTAVPAAAILKYEKTLGTSLRREQLPLSQPSPAPPPPPTPRFPFLVVLFTCYHSLWLQEKYILSRTKKFG